MRIGRASAITDTGRRRLQNEDAFVCEPPLFAVADGMGGAQAGEVASRLVAGALEELGPSFGASVASLVQEANTRVWEHALEDPTAAGIGTTVTVALVDEAASTVEVGHVGDSRAYRARAGQLEQLTADHTLVAELVRSGRLTQEEADRHPQRSVITRALGTDPDVDVDTFLVDAQPGDLFLICSDGLTSMVRDEDMQAAVLAGEGDPERIAEALVQAANRAGGEDNITVVLFEIVEGEPRTAAAPNQPEDAEPPAPVDGPAPAVDPDPAVKDVRHHGPGRGSRAAALSVILLVLLAALLILWWSIGR